MKPQTQFSTYHRTWSSKCGWQTNMMVIVFSRSQSPGSKGPDQSTPVCLLCCWKCAEVDEFLPEHP